VTFVDVTDRKAKELHMESIAASDPLTGVLNRRGFERDAAKRLTQSKDDATGALLFIDLNDFKSINDEFGHEIGDQLLKIAAERLRKSLRSVDIIGRPGGDEFVALVPDVDETVADRLAKRLTRALEEPYNIGKQRLYCAASIGLALYPRNANTLTGLLREADQAMYRAKARCRGVTKIRRDDLLAGAGSPCGSPARARKPWSNLRSGQTTATLPLDSSRTPTRAQRTHSPRGPATPLPDG
jgi:diguanylate cyclase (GGDEF)-like protein